MAVCPTSCTRVAGLGYNLGVRRLLLLSVLGAVAVPPPALQAQRFAAGGKFN